MTVVSPALKAMKDEAERISVRSTIGKQYARGERQPRAARDLRRSGRGFRGFGVEFYAEAVLLLLLFGLVAAHGAYFGGAR